MVFPEVFKRYFPPRMPCCFVRIHKTRNNAVKIPLEYAFNAIQNWETMVHKSLEKSLKIEKLMDILEKSLNFPQKSLNVLESSLNKNSLH